MNVINNPHNRMINRHKLNRHRLRRFPAAHNKDQFARASLSRPIGRNNRFAFRFLLLGERLDNQELDPFQPFIFLGGNNRANNAS
jgi:hypothetical protein